MKLIKRLFKRIFHHCYYYEELVEPRYEGSNEGLYECSICKRKRWFGGW